MKIQVVVEDGGNGWPTGHIPALPGCVSQGRTMEEFLANLTVAAEG